jgi:O-antigen ligase
MPLEQAMELGIPAALLWLAALLLILVRCTIGLVQRRRSQIHPALAIAAAGLLITHNLFDFSLANPAISALAAYLTGVGLAQSWPSGDLIAPVTASDPTDSPAGTAAHPMA